jgi:hypothetical protein
MPPAARELAEQLRALLDENGVSLRQLAAADDVHYSLTSLHRFFSGRALPPQQLVEVLGRRYGGDGATRERLRRLYERASAAEAAEATEVIEATEAGAPPAAGAPAPSPHSPATPAAVGRRRLLIPAALVLLAGGLAGAGVAAAGGLLDGSPREGGERAEAELLRGGAFDGDDPHPWWQHGEVKIRVRQGALRIDVRGGTSQPWDAMVGHSGVKLREGAGYTLRFTASASMVADMLVTVLREQQAAQPLVEARTWPVSLGPASQDFAFAFDSPLSTEFGQVTFRFGGGQESFTAFLDDISLTRDR